MPRIKLDGDHFTRHHDIGATKKRFKDCLKNFHGAGHIDHRRLSTLAEINSDWLFATNDIASTFVKSVRANLKGKRQDRWNHSNTLP